MDVTFLFYVFLSFVIASGGTYILFSSGRIVAAILYLVGVIAIESYFGSKWFSGTEVNVTMGAWPPSINVCPDMLSLYKNGPTPVCVDTVGVAPSGGIVKWTTGSTDPNAMFNLSTTKTGDERTKALCAEAKLKNVTWEGVWDGTTCLGGVPPMPPA